MQLVDVNILLKQAKFIHGRFNDTYVSSSQIIETSTIDAEPVRHGYIFETWETERPRRKFSCCGADCTKMTQWMWPKFCPYCGAKLDEKIHCAESEE